MSKKYTTNFLEDTNGSTGSANQVLVSTAAGIDWVDGSGSGIIGGPYLPLSAGSGFPLTGDLWLDDNLGASPSLYLQNGSDNYWRLVNGSTGIFSLKEGTSDRITILPGGNVGIGTTNPLAALQVNSITASAMSQVAGEAHIIGVNHDLSDTQMGTLNLTSTSRNTGASNQALGSSLTFSQNASKYVDGYEVVIGGIKTELMYTGNMNKSSIMNFYTHTNLGLTPKMSIDATGNVGIGTTSPTDKLTVNGNLSIFGNKIYNGSASNSAGVSFPSSTTRIDGYNGITFHSSTTTVGSQSERMRITNSGNVGIGTTSPGTKLHISAPGGSSQLTLERTGGGAGKAVLAGAAEGLIVYDDVYGAKMYVGTSGTYNGNVGIGTISPGAKLHIQHGGGAGSGLYVKSNVNRSKITVADNDSAAYVIAEGGKASYGTADSLSANNLTIETSGNVGIGTTNPLAKTHIKASNAGGDSAASGTLIVEQGSAPSIQLLSANSQTQTIKFADPQSSQIGRISYSHPSDAMFFVTNGTERMRITSTGNVGIGTTSPSEKLHVEGDSTTTALISTPANSGVSQLRIAIDGGLQGGINLIADEDNSIAKIVTNNSSRWPLAFYVRGSDGTNERMRIASTGNVGIGTTNPTTPLQVVGIAQIATGSDTAFYEGASVRMFGSQSYTFRNSPGQTRAIINVETTGVNAGNLSLYNASTVLTTKLSNAGDSYLNGGNVGIGTSSPSEKLEVSGNVKAETLIATDLTDGYVPYSKSGTLGLQDSKIYTQGAGIGVGTTTLAAGCHITSLSNISATGYRVSAMQTAPSSRGDTGTLGEIRITADYIYVCYATDSWKRVAIAQW